MLFIVLKTLTVVERFLLPHILYYSGHFQGNPKGIMLSHENIIASAGACMHQLGTYAPNNTDVMISYLPLAHMLERSCQVRS